MNRVLCIAAALVAPASLMAQGQTVVSRRGECQVTVPAGWVVNSQIGSADSPDKKMSVVVSSPRRMDTFSQLKSVAPTVYTKNKVTKSGAAEFQMEGASMAEKPDVYRAIDAGHNTFCIVEVDYQNGNVEEARRIARTLAGKK